MALGQGDIQDCECNLKKWHLACVQDLVFENTTQHSKTKNIFKKGSLLFSLIIFTSQSYIFRERRRVWVRKNEKRPKGGVHRLVGTLKGFAFSQEVALQLTEDTGTLFSEQDCAMVESYPLAHGERIAYSQVSWCTCGGMPESCEAVVEVFCSFVTLYLSNLIKEDPEVYFHSCHLVYQLMP